MLKDKNNDAGNVLSVKRTTTDDACVIRNERNNKIESRSEKGSKDEIQGSSKDAGKDGR